MEINDCVLRCMDVTNRPTFNEANKAMSLQAMIMSCLSVDINPFSVPLVLVWEWILNQPLWTALIIFFFIMTKRKLVLFVPTQLTLALTLQFLHHDDSLPLAHPSRQKKGWCLITLRLTKLSSWRTHYYLNRIWGDVSCNNTNKRDVFKIKVSIPLENPVSRSSHRKYHQAITNRIHIIIADILN